MRQLKFVVSEGGSGSRRRQGVAGRMPPCSALALPGDHCTGGIRL